MDRRPENPSGPESLGAGDPADVDDFRADLEHVDGCLGLTAVAAVEARALQIARDAKMVAALLLATPDQYAHNYPKLRLTLFEYGARVITAWVVKGEIEEQAKRLRAPIPAKVQLDSWSNQQKRDLAIDIVIAGIEHFERVGLRKWSASGGATIRTYFIGGCVLQAKKCAERRFKENQFMDSALAASEAEVRKLENSPSTLSGPLDTVLHQEWREDTLLRHAPDDQTRRALVLMSEGLTQGAAADAVGMSEKALERRRSRIRDQRTAKPEAANTAQSNSEGDAR
jgi:hypothetical protein